jgi:hypothetical protein
MGVHQHKSVDAQAMMFRGSAKQPEKQIAVDVVAEQTGMVDPAMNDVDTYVRPMNAWRARHIAEDGQQQPFSPNNRQFPQPS